MRCGIRDTGGFQPAEVIRDIGVRCYMAFILHCNACRYPFWSYDRAVHGLGCTGTSEGDVGASQACRAIEGMTKGRTAVCQKRAHQQTEKALMRMMKPTIWRKVP